LDRERQLHEHTVVFTDQCPVHIPTEERIDAGVTPVGVRSTEAEFSPPTNPWHELNVEQVRKSKHRRRLKTLPRVATEMTLHVLAYNLTRVTNIMGVQPLMAAMRA
jgi:hypothetical protein